ncbi:MFS transporter [Prauserella marina]|uniref:Na+/melibiose symporter n=1 Tax=Prauserella marina TaxID=530584 RepID=A0A222VRV4_9PSEU|nr:MFS transporter [Prauserella marina]ASR36473.1 MFS transporter [Prauserella marina]PWV73845.1 Na+/melibiose symporter-like transporter [Prauserella marina]SDD57327.1 Na+/melibiose symporter [Prauserella marina]
MSALGTKTRLGYSLGSFATGAFGTVPGLLLLPYLTDTMAVPAAAAGAIVLLPKAWDVLFNPIAGRISDAGLAKRGSRRRSLLLGGLVLAVCFAGLFAHPGFGSVGGDAAYVVAIFFVCATAFAFFQVPFNALPAELTDGYHERTRLTTWRIAVLALAILVSGAVAPAIANSVGGVDGYRLMGIFVGVLIALGTLGVYFGIRDVPKRSQLQPTPKLRALLATMREWRPFRWLLAVYFVQSLGVATLLAGVSYVARHVLGNADLQSLLFAGFVGPALLVMPVWDKLGRSGGKLTGFRVASAAFALALIGLVFAQVLPTAVVFAFVALAGIGYAGIQVFPLAILPDLISAEEERTGATRAGITAGVWTAAETLGLALGPGLFGLVLASGGYLSSVDASATQPDSAVTAITLGFSALPAVLILAGIPLLRRSVLGTDRPSEPKEAGA